MGRKRGSKAPEAPHMDERWAISYLDMMTVLFLTFVVLFSMSSIDAGKYEQLKNSLATGFGQEETKLDDTQPGVLNEEEPGEEPLPGNKEQKGLTADEKLQAIQSEVATSLEKKNQDALVEFDKINGKLVIRIVSGETLFSPDDAQLTPVAMDIMKSITPSIKKQNALVSVEGHADYNQPKTYESNWELSADRAVKMVRYMVEDQGFAPAMVSAAGYGDTKPIDGKRDMLDRNRRVDIVVLAADDPSIAAEKKLASEKKAKEAEKPAEGHATEESSGH